MGAKHVDHARPSGFDADLGGFGLQATAAWAF